MPKYCLSFSVAAAILAVAALSGRAPPASANLYIGLQQTGVNAGAIFTTTSGPILTLPLSFAGSYGQFEGVRGSGFGGPRTILPVLSSSTALAVNNLGAVNAGTLAIYVTSTNNTTPLGSLGLRSGMATANLVPPLKETAVIYLDPDNGIYALTTLLGSASFTTVSPTAIRIEPGVRI